MCVTGLTHEESVAINKSLLTLRQVIVALTNNQQQQPTQQQQSTAKHHVPHRDSKLTALLKQSLGGNSLTTFIACVSCNDAAYEETVSTLDYAAMARRVVNQVCVVTRTHTQTRTCYALCTAKAHEQTWWQVQIHV